MNTKEIIIKYLVSGILIDKTTILGGFRGYGKNSVNISSPMPCGFKSEEFTNKNVKSDSLNHKLL